MARPKGIAGPRQEYWRTVVKTRKSTSLSRRGTGNLEKQAEEKSTAQLMCRTWQHIWNLNRGEVEPDGNLLLWTVPCDRCDTTKTMAINRRSGLYCGASYNYPPDYAFHDLGALDAEERGSLRLLLLQRSGEL